MGLIVKELNELRVLLGDYRDGKINKNELDAQISIYNQTDKRVRNSLQYAALLIKSGLKQDAKRLLKGNLLGETENINDELPIYNRTKDRGKK